MIFEYYADVRLIVATMIATMGLILMLSSFPYRLQHTVFDAARRNIAAAYLFTPIITYLIHFSGLYEYSPYYRVGAKLVGYFWTSSMVVYTFARLLGVKAKLSEPIVVRGLAYCALYPIFIALAFVWGGEENMLLWTIVAVLSLILHAAWRLVYLVKLYRYSQFKISNYYSEDLEPQYRWLMHSVFYIVALSILSIFASFLWVYSLWYGVVFMAICLWVYSYVFWNFVNFIFNFVAKRESTELPNAGVIPPDDDHEKITLSPEIRAQIAKKISEWVEAKGFTDNGITIQSVSSQLYTNRTYLSMYINSTYGCSFRVWITRLRVEAAKKMMFLQINITIEEVATAVGFASVTSFVHAFKTTEGKSPQRWRSSKLSPPIHR